MSEPKSERELLEEISRKLDKVIGGLAIMGKGQNDQIRVFRSLNLDWGDIGNMVGLNPDAARKRLGAQKNGAGRMAKQ